MLSSYLDEVQNTPLCFEPLSVRAPLDTFLHLLESYLQAGVNCKHLHELKERELFIIFRTAYTKSEIIQLLYPIMGIEETSRQPFSNTKTGCAANKSWQNCWA